MDTYLLHNIERSLTFHLHQNAIFLAERLFAQFPTFFNLFKLASCYMQSGQIQMMYHFLRHHAHTWKVYSTLYSNTTATTTNSSFSFGGVNINTPLLSANQLSEQDLDVLDQIYLLYVVCCIKLDHLLEAENIIMQFLSKRSNEMDHLGTHFNGSSGSGGSSSTSGTANKNCNVTKDFDMISNMNYWLGIVCRFTDRKQMAIACFQKALSTNPMMWSAFENLSQLGAVVDSTAMFDSNKAQVALTKYKNSAVVTAASACGSQQSQQQQQLLQQSSMLMHQTPQAQRLVPQPQQQPQLHPPQSLNHSSISNGSSSTTRGGGRTSMGSLLMTPQASSMEVLLEANPLQFTDTPSSGIMTPIKELTTPASNISYMSPSRFDDFTIKSPHSYMKPPTRRESSSSVASSSSSVKTPSVPNHRGGTPASTSNSFFCTPSPISAPTEFNTPQGPNRKPKPTKKLQGPINKVLNPKLFDATRLLNSSTTSSNSSFIGSGSMTNSSLQQLNVPSSASSISITPMLSSRSSSSSSSSLSSSHHGEGNTEVTERDIIYLFELLGAISRSLQLYYQFRCKEAIQSFTRLPPKHFQTGWVLSFIGRCYFEMSQYENGEKTFEQVLKLEPYRLDGLEVYSTILWHLRKKKQLSFLAHHMSEVDKLSPQTLCAIGNCFSLQKDHESALRFFERATKVDSSFTYAYTLAGHESFANDDLEEALMSYRTAIRIDCRHYNAWYGIGIVYFRQEKFEQAEYHFRRALQINDKSSILYCYTGMALMAQHKNHEALDMLNCALQIHPQNPVAKFKKANVLMSLNNSNEALRELNELKLLVPKEASVHFTIGKIYAQMGLKDQALLNFNTALDLERTGQKENPFIKEQIAKLFEEQMEDDEELDDDTANDQDEYDQYE